MGIAHLREISAKSPRLVVGASNLQVVGQGVNPPRMSRPDQSGRSGLSEGVGGVRWGRNGAVRGSV
ncbi:hypothetical protein PhaeoP13_01999 [Phaeobacter piscinae]|uniref:Uncharacterized protein n=1 Tax=Phaeobacter piscinae TaxID=1580596 RepID=A0AAN1GRX0_9RHOB|nr:hypothetical protein PhaeoP13_01999 [Phaeobacter piscinae]